MSPKKKQKAGAKAIFSALTAATLIAAGSLTACSNDSSSSKPQTIEMSKVSVELAYTATPRLDSIVLDCIGADTLHIVHDNKDSSFELDLFPHDRWVLSAKKPSRMYGALTESGRILRESPLQCLAPSCTNFTLPMLTEGFAFDGRATWYTR